MSPTHQSLKKLVLASRSETRLSLLKTAYIYPDIIDPADIDESIFNNSPHSEVALLLAIEKGQKVASKYADAIILSADTVVIAGSKMLDKAHNDEDVAQYINLMSDNLITIYSGVSVISVSGGKIIYSNSANSQSKIAFKKISQWEKNKYLASKEGIGVAGGLKIEGYASSFVKHINGSMTGIMGLPLYETIELLSHAKL